MRLPNISLQSAAKFLKWSKIFKSLGLTVTLATSSVVTTPVTTSIIVASSIVVFDINTQVVAQKIESGVFSGEDGVIYGMYPDGRLQWYRHDGWRDGSSNWTAGNGGRQVGTGWNVFWQ